MAELKGLAIICPCGPLWKWGYENTAGPCLRNQADAVGGLYLVHSAIQDPGAEIPTGSNVVSMSSRETWFHPEGLAPDDEPMENYGGAVFTHLHERNYALGRLQAWRDGFRVVLYTQSNWYIAEVGRERLRRAVEAPVAGGGDFGLVNRRGQCGRVVLKADKAAYLLVNMTNWAEGRVATEVVDRKLRGGQVGEHPEIVDCGSEQTPEQLAQHLWRARCERYAPEDLVRVCRLNALRGLPGEPLSDPTGLEIAARSRPEHLSGLVLGG